MDLSTSPRLYAYTGGKTFDAAKPTVVFLHGAQNDHSVWILQSRYLAHHGYGVLALDLPGHMRSEGPALDTVEAMADRIADALRSAEVRQFIAVGQSMGSLIALELAKRLPESVRGAVLVDVPAFQLVAEATEALAGERALLEQALREGGPGEAVRAWLAARLRPARRQ